MKTIFDYICYPLLHINNNVYTFLSGIAISVSTNIFSTIVTDTIGFCSQWNLYVSVLSFLISGALLLYMAAKMMRFQNLAFSQNGWKESIIKDATNSDYKKWILRFSLVILFTILGIVFLSIRIV